MLLQVSVENTLVNLLLVVSSQHLLLQQVFEFSTINLLFYVFSLENPFVRTDSNKNITAFLGDNVTMIFLAARNSNGNSNGLSNLQGYFMADNGSNSTFNINQNCGNNDESICYQYRYSINKIRPQYAGVYYARVLGKTL